MGVNYITRPTCSYEGAGLVVGLFGHGVDLLLDLD